MGSFIKKYLKGMQNVSAKNGILKMVLIKGIVTQGRIGIKGQIYLVIRYEKFVGELKQYCLSGNSTTNGTRY